MPLSRSKEDIHAQANCCTICRNDFLEGDDTLKTACSHQFHRTCLLDWLKHSSTCPQCRARCNSKDLSRPGPRTRSQVTPKTTSDNPQPLTNLLQDNSDIAGATCLPLEAPVRNQNPTVNPNTNNIDEEARLRNLVGAVISARQATMFENLDTRIAQIVEQKVEQTLANALSRLNLNSVPNIVAQAAAPQPAAAANTGQNLNTPRLNRPSVNSTPLGARDHTNHENCNRQIDQFRFSDISSVPNSGRIAQLIASWDIKFDGTSKLSVDNFLYRIESQVIDTLGGNFNLLCEHIQNLFINDAKDWYWRYRRSVDRVTWPTLCQALRTNFQEHRSDTEIKELIRARKQGQTESFDEFRNSILKMTEALQTPFPEAELVEVLQRNLRPRIRQQLLFVPVNSLAELRRLCLKGEHLLNEINKTNTTTVLPHNQRQLPRRQLNELCEDPEEDNKDWVEVDEVSKQATNAKLQCWNCREEGHRFFDCLEDRTVFCYGCGSPAVYKPNCTKCNAGNFQKSEGSTQNPRHDQKKKM